MKQIWPGIQIELPVFGSLSDPFHGFCCQDSLQTVKISVSQPSDFLVFLPSQSLENPTRTAISAIIYDALRHGMEIAPPDGVSEIDANHPTWRFGMHVSGYARYSPENKTPGRGARLCLHTEIEARSRRLRRWQDFHIKPFIAPTGSPAGFLSFSHSLLGNTAGDLGHPHLKTLRQCPVGGDGNILYGPRFGGPQSF